jgi:hypothetical protein
MPGSQDDPSPATVFISYAHEDEAVDQHSVSSLGEFHERLHEQRRHRA